MAIPTRGGGAAGSEASAAPRVAARVSVGDEAKADFLAPILLEAVGGACIADGVPFDVIHFADATTGYSNLNGWGDGDIAVSTPGEQALYLRNVATSKAGKQIDLKVEASETYQASKPSKNGMADGFGQVRQIVGAVLTPQPPPSYLCAAPPRTRTAQHVGLGGVGFWSSEIFGRRAHGGGLHIHFPRRRGAVHHGGHTLYVL